MKQNSSLTTICQCQYVCDSIDPSAAGKCFAHHLLFFFSCFSYSFSALYFCTFAAIDSLFSAHTLLNFGIEIPSFTSGFPSSLTKTKIQSSLPTLLSLWLFMMITATSITLPFLSSNVARISFPFIDFQFPSHIFLSLCFRFIFVASLLWIRASVW